MITEIKLFQNMIFLKIDNKKAEQKRSAFFYSYSTKISSGTKEDRLQIKVDRLYRHNQLLMDKLESVSK